MVRRLYEKTDCLDRRYTVIIHEVGSEEHFDALVEKYKGCIWAGLIGHVNVKYLLELHNYAAKV